MKSRLVIIALFVLSLFIFQNCQPLTSMQIETMVPAKIDFPGNFNKVVFVNLENDLNNDQEIDTVLYHLITKEMTMGFLDALKSATGVDSSNFLYVKGYPNKNELYKFDTISWNYLERLSSKSNADIFIVLDSMKMSMESDISADYFRTPTEYYKYRQLSINAHWSVFDLLEKRRLDSYNYIDTLLWDVVGYSKVEVNKKLTSLEQSIKEACYFTALDYTKRIFPGWQTEYRYYFITGNKDFKKAATLVLDNKWEEASDIWELYVDNIDTEIASRACYNLALASEMMGNLSLAVAWAEKSNQIKPKDRTEYYISLLKYRKENEEKLLEQIY